MTPLRLVAHITRMTSDANTETVSTIKAMLIQYKSVAHAEKEWDIEWYCDQVINQIDKMVVDGWQAVQSKQQLRGLLSSIIPFEGL